MTLENFRHRCCITGETTGPVLQAAHIKPVTQDGRHSILNGLLLRADLHILYDSGLVGIDHTYRVRVSPQIKDLYLNGRVYYAHEGEKLRSLPTNSQLRPDPELLDWHMQTVFVRK
jgi:putative restriction endonuclease